MSQPIPLVPGCKIRTVSKEGPGVWHDVLSVDPLDVRNADGRRVLVTRANLQVSYDAGELEVLQPDQVEAHPLTKLLNQAPCPLCDDTGWAPPGTLSRVPCMCAAGREQADKGRRQAEQVKPEPGTSTLTVTWASEMIRLLQVIQRLSPQATREGVVREMADMPTDSVYTLLAVCMVNGLAVRSWYPNGVYKLTAAGKELAERGASA